MIPGRDQVIACPHCQAPSRFETFASGNTLHGRLWTDFYRVFPMMPFPPDLIGCHACGKCFWVKDAKALGFVDPYGRHPQNDQEWMWSRAPRVRWPSPKAIYAAIADGMCKTKEEAGSARLIALQRRNDEWRDDETSPGRPPDADDAGNMEELLALSTEPAHGLIRCEIFRYLARFVDALDALKGDLPAPAAVLAFIRSLCASGDARVRLIAPALLERKPANVVPA